MGIYVGTMPPGPGLVTLPVCFTGVAAKLMRWAIGNFHTYSFAIMGGLIGFVSSFFVGPDGANQIGGAIGGLIVGAVCGVIMGLLTPVLGACTCPPPADGFCVDLLFLIIPGTSIAIPLWPFIIPGSGGCATVMPAGCP